MHRLAWRLLAAVPILCADEALAATLHAGETDGTDALSEPPADAATSVAASDAAAPEEPTAKAPTQGAAQPSPNGAPAGSDAPNSIARPSTAPGMVGDRGEPVMLNHQYGTIGLFHASLPDTGDRLTFRFRVFTDFFRRDGFIYESPLGTDRQSRVRSGVSLGFSPVRWAEVFFTARGSASRNDRAQPERQDAETLFALGDVDLGVKGAHRFTKYGIGVGGQAGLGLLASSNRLFASSVNFWFDALLSVDARYLTRRQFPFRATANIGWILDNSLQSVDYGSITDPISAEVVRFGTGGNHSRVRMRYAIDFPVRFGEQGQFGLDPILEWSWDVSTQSQSGFEIPSAGRTPLPRSTQWATLGLRANVVSGLFLDAAVDIGVVSPSFEFGPPTPPWQVLLGLGWSFDPKPIVREVAIERSVPAAKPASAPPMLVERRVIGKVVNADGQPVADARVAFPGRAVSQLVTDPTGAFTSYRFPPGEVPIQVIVGDEVVHEGVAVVGDDKDTQLTIKLERPPGPVTGVVRATFVDDRGKPVKVRMHVVGGDLDQTFDATDAGTLVVELPAGEYQATLTAKGLRDETLTLKVPEKGELALQETLETKKPPAPTTVTVRGQSVRLRHSIRYAGSDVASSSHAILDDLAAFLNAHPEIVVIEIGVHTDDRGAAQRRSEDRAEAVKSYLVSRGIDPSRVRARGYGATRPIALNLTPSGRAKNNRTLITIVEGSSQP